MVAVGFLFFFPPFLSPSPFLEPDTLENCDLGCITHFLLDVVTQEVRTVKGQWVTSPEKHTLTNGTGRVVCQLIRRKRSSSEWDSNG